LYLFDADVEKLLLPGAGGLIMADPVTDGAPWQATSKIRDAPGKYRRGVHCYVRPNGFLWMPIEGLLDAREFTIEFFVKGDVSWANAFGANLFSLGLSADEALMLDIHQNVMVLRFFHNQATAPVSAVLVYEPTPTIPAGQWVSLAITFVGGVLRLYVNGTAVGTVTNVGAPAVMASPSATTGLMILGFNGAGADGWSLSDLRLSRKARTPGQSITVDDLNVLTVNTTIGATVNQKLLGGLLTLSVPATETMAQIPTKAVTGLRSGKYLSVTPIKTGAPDVAHPTSGISGAYSYDWRVVDRTLDYHTRLGMATIGDAGSTPTLLGGNVQPYSGGQLDGVPAGPTTRADFANYCNIPPNDNEAWGRMVRDLVYHTLIEVGHDVRYWSVWNEPDGSGWAGTQDQFHAMYVATVGAIKLVDPTVKVGAGDFADFNTDWVKNLIQFCATHSVPLDFISWHYYSGNLGELNRARMQVTQWATQYGLNPVPFIAVGEWCWQIRNFHGQGVPPWRTFEYHRNDWHAAFVAASLIEMQRLGVAYAVYTSPVAEDGSFGTATDGLLDGFDSSGLMSRLNPWANLNVFRQWSMLKPTIVSSSYVGQPGVFAQASKDAVGSLSILLSHLRYRKDVTPSVKVQLPTGYSGKSVTHYLVDDQHSNMMDAGAGHLDLEMVAAAPVATDNSLTVALRPRSVHLLVVGGDPPTGDCQAQLNAANAKLAQIHDLSAP
jgi:hypothetical protein